VDNAFERVVVGSSLGFQKANLIARQALISVMGAYVPSIFRLKCTFSIK
jgi:hypothetical protein